MTELFYITLFNRPFLDIPVLFGELNQKPIAKDFFKYSDTFILKKRKIPNWGNSFSGYNTVLYA